MLASTAAACGSDSGGSGDTLKIGVQGIFGGLEAFGFDFKGVTAGAEAAVEAINKKGGINGRKLELVTCDEGDDPNGGIRCARELIDEEVVAVIGVLSITGEYMTVLDSAGIPSIANLVTRGDELTSEFSFPVTSGGPGIAAGTGAVISEAGATRVKAALTGDAVEDAKRIPLGLRGSAEFAGHVVVPLQVPDVSPTVAAALSGGTDGLIALAEPSGVAKLISRVRDVDPSVKIATSSFNLTKGSLQAVGEKANGVLVADWTAPPTLDDPSVKRWVADMEAFDPKLDKNVWSANSWAGVQVFAHVAKQLPKGEDVTSESVVEGLKRLDGLDLGVVPPIQFKTPVTEFGAGDDVTRVFTSEMFFSVIENGEKTPFRKSFQDVLGR